MGVPRTTHQWLKPLYDYLDAGLDGSGVAATELTIASGVITRTQAAHRVDTESEGASDDLETINGGHAEDLLWLRPESGARTVVLKHNVGNIICPNAADISLADAQDFALLYYANSKWTVIAASTLVPSVGLLAGAQTFTGTKTFAGLIATLLGAGTAQALSGAGAVNVTSLVTMFTSTAGAQALTLADGTIAGQLKIVHHTVDGGSGVLTPAHAGNFATFTFTDIHDACILMWNGTAWDIVMNVGGTVG